MDIDEYYENHYEGVVNQGIVGKFASFYHNQMEKNFRGRYFEKILEIGAGKGQHFDFVICSFGTYIESDIRSQNISTDASGKPRVSVIADAESLKEFKDNEFDRLIATCLLAHLADPLKACLEWRRVAKKNGGIISIYVPCEPSLLLRIAQSLSTKPKARKVGIDYENLHYLEHRNHYFFIRSVIKKVFENDSIKILGVPHRFLPFDLKLYEIYEITLNV